MSEKAMSASSTLRGSSSKQSRKRSHSSGKVDFSSKKQEQAPKVPPALTLDRAPDREVPGLSNTNGSQGSKDLTKLKIRHQEKLN